MVTLRAFFVVLLFALVSVIVVITEKQNPLSDEFIDLINSKQNSWKAGRNFPVNTPYSYIKNLMGVLPDKAFKKLTKLKQKHDPELIANLPESFDPRDKWPNCPSLNEIRDQGACGSCWAFGAVEVMTDRYCIYSNESKQFHFSAQDVLACSTYNGCHGSWPMKAFKYWKENGIVSGGNYNSSEGCQPYEIAACEHHVPGELPPCGDTVDTPECKKSCENNHTDYYADKRRGKDWYNVDSNEDHIKAELFKNGPVEVVFTVYEDFLNYKQGVYKHTPESRFVGLHAVKMLAWGVENGQKYWLIANSWNPHWGDKGFFKIIRGENHCGIEDEVLAGEPLIE